MEKKLPHKKQMTSMAALAVVLTFVASLIAKYSGVEVPTDVILAVPVLGAAVIGFFAKEDDKPQAPSEPR